ncbi:hypothetical protein ACSV5M_08550 [Cellvibrio sp. ARAG 10.3]|uniref:hypothetical protein n=1 Tax=Cellvibrio sp. ARAG 10.3 TaxID=3451358 RepID=UPI003F471CDA
MAAMLNLAHEIYAPKNLEATITTKTKIEIRKDIKNKFNTVALAITPSVVMNPKVVATCPPGRRLSWSRNTAYRPIPASNNSNANTNSTKNVNGINAINISVYSNHDQSQ